jgi:hypothetical protein
MDISYWSLILFIIGTILYFYFGKTHLTFDMLNNETDLLSYYSANNYMLSIYVLCTIIIQFGLNIAYLNGKCGTLTGGSIKTAAIFTFVPWVFIFSVMVATLVIFPGFKTAFSNVIGYFVVAGPSNELLSSILIDTNVNNLIQKTPDGKEKTEMIQAAEAIMKICGNKSILINQMNPENFNSIWNTLKPLMVEGAFTNSQKKQSLLDLVVLRDNIGESLWYIYTAILISSIVYYNLATTGCVQDINTIKANHDKYIQEQEEADKQKAINNTTNYIVS